MKKKDIKRDILLVIEILVIFFLLISFSLAYKNQVANYMLTKETVQKKGAKETKYKSEYYEKIEQDISSSNQKETIEASNDLNLDDFKYARFMGVPS